MTSVTTDNSEQQWIRQFYDLIHERTTLVAMLNECNRLEFRANPSIRLLSNKVRELLSAQNDVITGMISDLANGVQSALPERKTVGAHRRSKGEGGE